MLVIATNPQRFVGALLFLKHLKNQAFQLHLTQPKNQPWEK